MIDPNKRHGKRIKPCQLCGKPCSGKTCRECYRKETGRSLSKLRATKKRYQRKGIK